MTEHPITPPPELVQQWASEFYGTIIAPGEASIAIANQAARWGADQQLQLDAKWLDHNALNETHLKITPIGNVLKEAMRPKPLSLKKRALKILEEEPEADDMKELVVFDVDQVEIIRKALEQLDD